MALELHFHPFASFCQKVLIALYENETPFEAHLVDLGNEKSRAAFYALWPVGKMPLLQDTARSRVVVETSIIIEYLAQFYPGKAQLLPADATLALEVRMQDRFYDLYVSEPMQKIVGDRLRPKDQRDAFGVNAARTVLRTSYGIIEKQMAMRTWAAGETFTMADCSAAPALFYSAWVEPFAEEFPNVARYFDRLQARPSFARVIEEAKPFRHFFPQA